MLRPTLGKVRSMTDIIQLEPVDEIQVTALYKDLVDNTAPSTEGVERLSYKTDSAIVSNLLAEERNLYEEHGRHPHIDGCGLSAVEITGTIRRRKYGSH